MHDRVTNGLHTKAPTIFGDAISPARWWCEEWPAYFSNIVTQGCLKIWTFLSMLH